MKRITILLLSLFPALFVHAAEFAGIFGSDMVLQRDRELPVRGFATQGEKLTVSLGDCTRQTTADEHGKWRVTFPPRPAGGPVTLQLHSTSGTTVLKNILFGDIFLCSGQSNMEWLLRNAEHGAEAIAASTDSGLRLCFPNRAIAALPRNNHTFKWLSASPKSTPNFSAVAYFFGKNMRSELKIPVGLINISRGASRIEAWTDRDSLKTVAPEFLTQYDQAQHEYPRKYQEYRTALAAFQQKYPNRKALSDAQAVARAAGKPIPVRPFVPLGPEHPHCPAGLYNALIHPLGQFPLKGVIFYQGEADVARAASYPARFAAMAKCWRRNLGNPELPFIQVQLPNYGKSFSQCRENQWAELREAQTLAAAADPLVDFVVTLDVGEPTNLHPKNKKTVGERLAAAMLNRVYNKQHLPYRGPRFRSVTFSGDTAKVAFSDSSGLHSTDGQKIRTFQIAGQDGKFHWADAQIDGENVLVRSPAVPQPTALRYAWEYSPKVNLVNGAGLPAAPFSTKKTQGEL